MSVVTRPDLFPATTKPKLFALPGAGPTIGAAGPQGAELLKRNLPRYAVRVEATLVSGKPSLTVVGGEVNALEPGAILVGTSIPSEATLVKRTEPLPATVAPPQGTQVWEMSANAEATVTVPEVVLAYPPGTKLTEYNPENWKPVLVKVGEPTAAANGELAIAATVEGQGGGPVLAFLEAAAGRPMAWLTCLAHASLNVKVKTTTTPILPANPQRQFVRIENLGATNVIYLGLGKAAVLKEGIGSIAVGGAWEAPVGGGPVWTGAINGIAETAEVSAAVTEF